MKEESGIESIGNPLVAGREQRAASTGESETSSAYYESYKAARESGRWEGPAQTRRGPGGLRNVSFKALVLVIFLLLGGVIMLITGLVFFMSSAPASENEEQERRGMDLLIVASIMLLPGLWAARLLARGDYSQLDLG